MEDKLYYEVQDVSQPQQIEKAYKYAVANNYKYYRCLSKAKKVYGWVDGKHALAQQGQEWFENPTYKANIETPATVATAMPETSAKTVAMAMPDVKSTTSHAQATLNNAFESIKQEAEKYEELYNAKCAEYESFEKKAKENDAQWKQKYNAANAEWETKNNTINEDWQAKYNALKADHDAMAKNYNIIIKAAKVFVTLANEVKDL